MSDGPDVKIGGKSQEEVALILMDAVLGIEGKSQQGGIYRATRAEVLNTYRECLKIVRNPFLQQ